MQLAQCNQVAQIIARQFALTQGIRLQRATLPPVSVSLSYALSLLLWVLEAGIVGAGSIRTLSPSLYMLTAHR